MMRQRQRPPQPGAVTNLPFAHKKGRVCGLFYQTGRDGAAVYTHFRISRRIRAMMRFSSREM